MQEQVDRVGPEGGDQRSVRELVRAFQGGDTTAYSEIYRRCQPLARRVSYRLLASADDADEAAQEAMIRVYRGLGRFNGQYKLEAWVARIATNVALDTLRAKSCRPRNGAADTVLDTMTNVDVGRVDDPGELVELASARDEVRDVLVTLPPHHREVLVLREFEELSHQDIAAVMGTSPARVKALIHRAKRSFRKAWRHTDGHRGIAAFLPPFVFPGKVAEVLRRLAMPAQEVAATATASPAAVATAVTGAERFGAALVAAVMVGSVGIATTRAQRGPEREPREDRVTLLAEAPASDPLATVNDVPPHAAVVAPKVPDQDDTAESPKGGDPTPAVTPSPEATTETSPAPTPSPSPTTEPPPASPSPEPPPSPPAPTVQPNNNTAPKTDPSPDASPQPRPSPEPPPPAPEWTMTASAPRTSSDRQCGCDPKSRRWQSDTSGKAGKRVRFRQEAVGAVLDAEGDAAWRLWMEYAGDADGNAGSLSARFYLEGGQHGYAASGSLSGVERLPGGAYRYTYSGTYRATDGQGPSPIGIDGPFTATVEWWADGTTLYRVAWDIG